MPKYLIKATVLFHYEIEADDHEHALVEASEPNNLDTQEFLRDIIDTEAILIDENYQGLWSIPNPNG
jgi:hypothetical protein